MESILLQETSTHHSDGIIEQGLAKNYDEKHLVDVYFLKYSQYSDGVHRRNETSKEQEIKYGHIQWSCTATDKEQNKEVQGDRWTSLLNVKDTTIYFASACSVHIML